MQRRVARLEKRNRPLAAVLRILSAHLRIDEPDLSRVWIEATDKTRLLRAMARTRFVLGRRRVVANRSRECADCA